VLRSSLLDREAEFDGSLERFLGLGDPPLPSIDLDERETSASLARLASDQTVELNFGVIEAVGFEVAEGQAVGDFVANPRAESVG
jgi:hypothetical protein